MSFFVTQHKGGLGEEPIIIQKTLTQKDLEELGFFPLSESEQRYLDRTGIVTIQGDNKSTTIRRR